MKQGDLVKMKYSSWWTLRDRRDYTEQVGVVYEAHGPAIKVLMPDNKIKTSFTDYWEKIEK
tara:strand:+ start:669 stop:851 length:183 start_codon:yes stop_codon:yes gene_type:complete